MSPGDAIAHAAVCAVRGVALAGVQRLGDGASEPPMSPDEEDILVSTYVEFAEEVVQAVNVSVQAAQLSRAARRKGRDDKTVRGLETHAAATAIQTAVTALMLLAHLPEIRRVDLPPCPEGTLANGESGLPS